MKMTVIPSYLLQLPISKVGAVDKEEDGDEWLASLIMPIT
jgi:hypothetical protein